MAALLFGVTSRDAVTFAVAGAMILLVAAVAALGPGLKAMRANPTEILRLE
jgi:ABC-type lipoprotein release transport system permease subunit